MLPEISLNEKYLQESRKFNRKKYTSAYFNHSVTDLLRSNILQAGLVGYWHEDPFLSTYFCHCEKTN